MEHNLKLPLTHDKAISLSAGDTVYLSGIIYTARDAAHKRFLEIIDGSEPLPFPIEDATIYYVGPTPKKPGQIIGSAGPTTSYRMDSYTPKLLELGLRGMIGKGVRSAEVIETMKQSGAVYFGTIGGAGALLADCVKSSKVIAFADLGTEAVRKLVVEDFPVVVVIDSKGENLYKTGRRDYLKTVEESENM